jgi:glutathione reductase (NADPH)
MKTNDFDLFIIGAGSGGVRAARLAAAQGAKVAVAEEFRYGGTCVIRGCVPKKLMVNASDFKDFFEDSNGFGWSVGNTTFSWQEFLKAKDKEIERLENIYEKNMKGSGVELFKSRAKLVARNKVELDDGRAFTARTVLIATGGRPFVPEFDGNEHVITSNEIFELKKLPSRILIVGGGYIASEFSGIFNGLGVDVTQIYRGNKILRGFDTDIRDHVMDSMITRGIDIKCGINVINCKKFLKKLVVTLSDSSIIETDCVLYATGRLPNTSNLGLEEMGVVLDRVGAVKINELQQSSVESIYAIGDVTNRLNLTPVAIRDAISFVETAIKNNPSFPDHKLVATAVFTRPEIGTVGLTEEEAIKTHSIETYHTKFKPLANTLSGRDERTLMKMIVEEPTGKVLGCHLVGPNSAEMIQLAAVAIKMGATKDDFDKTCAVHPTMAEELVTLK